MKNKTSKTDALRPLNKHDVMKSLPTDKQLDAVCEAVDFIAANTDSAEDQKYWSMLRRQLNQVWKKGIRLKLLVGNVS